MIVVKDLKSQKNENEQVVQFSLTNTTSSSISVNLFDVANLTNQPTSFFYTSNPNTSIGTFGSSPFVWNEINPTNGYLYCTSGTDTIEVYDTNNNNLLVVNIVVPLASFSVLVYNSINNTIYVFDSTLYTFYIIDCNSNTVISSVLVGSSINTILFIPSNNKLYISSGGVTFSLDCNTNIITPTSLISYDDYVYNPYNGLVYAVESISSVFDTINPLTDSVIQSISGVIYDQIALNESITSPYVYCVTQLSGDVYIYNWNNSNSFVSSLSPSIGQLIAGVYDSNTNVVYFGSNSGNLLIVDSNNNYQTSFIALSLLTGMSINPNVNSLFIATPFTNNINQVTTTGIANTPYFITGSVNYNYFVQNIETEPILVNYINIISSQNQLSKVLQVTDIDSDGNQKIMPHFPILGVSSWQEQGNRGYVDFKGKLILDGRTFISNYILNPNEQIILEIHYEQLSRNQIKSIFNNILPKKIPLKNMSEQYIEI